MGFSDLETLMKVAVASKYRLEHTPGVWKCFVLTQLGIDMDLVPQEYEPMKVDDTNSSRYLYKTIYKGR
ncbi:hypothetical protein FRX31_007992, partial [Thalictrum thalictroides]